MKSNYSMLIVILRTIRNTFTETNRNRSLLCKCIANRCFITLPFRGDVIIEHTI